MKTFLILVLAGGAAHANGFLLNEFDARAIGRGDATTATETDASSIYYNIGGLAVASGTNVMITGALIAPNASFTDATTGIKTDSTTSPQVVPGVFVSSRLSDLIAVGVGFSTPFGLAISWPDSSPQNDVIQSQALHTFFITPSVGVNLGSFVPGLSVGAGFDIVPSTIELQQQVYFGTDRGSAHLAGTGTGFGARFGAMYKPQALPRLSIGAMWRSDVKIDYTGTGNFDAPAPYRSELPPDGPVSTSITMPQSVSGGVAYRPIDNLELEADVIWTNWSKFKDLNIDVPASMGTGTMTIAQTEAYTDTTTLRIGVEYAMPALHTAFRVGYIYDPTPVPPEHLSAQLPDINRNDVSAGASYAFGNYAVHLGLLVVLPGTNTTSSAMYTPEYKGTYDVSAFVGALSLSGKVM